MDSNLSVRGFVRLYSNVDEAWRAWNATYPSRSMSRAAFRAAAR